MSNVNFTAVVTFPEEAVTAFATKRGWTPGEEGNPNPPASAFCEQYFRKILIEQISVDRVSALNAQLLAVKEDGLKQINAGFEQAIIITST